MILIAFYTAWVLATLVEIWLGWRRKQWLGWILAAPFLLFAVWACPQLAAVDVRVSAQIVFCLPWVWLPSVFYLAYFFGKWKTVQWESKLEEGEDIAHHLDK